MKTSAEHISRIRHFAWLAIMCVAYLLDVTPLRAGLTLDLNVVRYDYGSFSGYYFTPGLTTNNTAPAVPFGDYQITSSGYPTNGSWALYHFDTNGFNQFEGGNYGYGDFDSMSHELTNGTWSIFVTNTVTTNIYYFTVTQNLISNDLPNVAISSPTNSAINMTNRPTYAWQGPTNYNKITLYTYNYGSDLPATQTNLLSPTTLYQGINSVTVHYYYTNSPSAVVTSLPTNNAAQPISSWVSRANLDTYGNSQFTVGIVDGSGTSHTLVAHYAWDATNIDGTASGADTSGNAYDLNFGGSYGSQGDVNSTTNKAAGPRAIQFHDGDRSSAGYVGWNPTPTNLLTALAGSFSVSCWIKTTQNGFGWDQAPAYYGAGIVSADNAGQANDIIPIALTGRKVGFNTGGDFEDVTLNSTAIVNDGIFHHVVVTRNQQTGQKIIYIDGVLDSFSSGTTNLLNEPQLLTIGALSDARNSDAPSTYYYNGYDGFLDDLQIYSGVLSSNEVTQLYQNPGTTANQIINVPLVARYNFEDTNSPGMDSSGNRNDSNCTSGSGNPNPIFDTASTDAAIGSFAREWFGDTSICFYPNGADSFNNLSNAYYGSFSISAWVKTTNSVNDDYANAYYGSPILFEYSDPTNQAIFSITGSKAAYTVGNPGGSDTTLHSTTAVNDGNYHLVAVTRNSTNGILKLYVDGNLEASDLSTNGARIASSVIYLAGGYNGPYKGLLDDVRIYGGELSASDVSILAGNSPDDFNAALNTTNLAWITGGDARWIVQSSTTRDGLAAQSGSVTGLQSSRLSATVTGPGTLTFYWSSQDDCNNFDFEFDIDGAYQNDILCSQAWIQDGPYSIPAGEHTLSWTTYANGDTNLTEVGFLDQVSFVPTIGPVITFQPVDQTNYPGYPLTLLANATSNPTATWQWYKVSSGLIVGATSPYYSPTNFGTAGVAGSYYAVADNGIGSATTRTAIVTFVSAALPPDWTRVFQTQLTGNFDNPRTNYGIASLVDASGNVYSANSFSGTNYFDTNTFVSGPGRFASGLFKHTASGTGIWGRAITNNGSGNSYPQCLARAPGDGVYMSGVFFGTNGIGTNILQETAGATLYLARFDSAGNVLWVRTFGGTNAQFQSYHQLVSDPAGNVTISALGNNLVNFGTTNVLAEGQKGVLAQYDPNGNVRWISIPSGWVQYMTYDAGRIYVVIEGNETNYIGGITKSSDRKFALAALNATNGQAFWLGGFGSSSTNNNPLGFNDDSPAVSVSSSNVFVTGSAWGSSAVFDSVSVSWSAPNGQYFARYDTNGTAQLATSFGGTNVWPWAAVADAAGNVYVTGDFNNYATFGDKVISGPRLGGIQDGFYGQMFLAKFDRNGNSLWVRQAQSVTPTSFVNVRDLSLATDGVWVCGFVNDYANFGTNIANRVYGPVTVVGFPFGYLYYYVGGFLAKVTDGSPVGLPVVLLAPQQTGGNFQVQFQSQNGFTHAVQYRTNLALGSWQTYSNVTGDGALKTIPVPMSVFNPSKQGFIRVSTQ